MTGAATLAEAVAADLGVGVSGYEGVSGGDVAAAYRLTLADGRTVFAKTHPSPPPGFFTTEAAGLGWLAATDTVRVPTVLAVADEPPARLVLDWVAQGARPTDDEAFGRSLAGLHRAPWPAFGRPDGRTTGSLALPNDPADTWSEFFAERRLRPLLRIAADRGALPTPTLEAIEALLPRLDEVVPAEPPSLVHGDLWAGNRIADEHGRSWVIDPAAHGNHREWDLAMMQLFGGFPPTTFAAYDEAFPLADGWRDRIPLFQLPPLIVHAVKFGGGYAAAVDRAVRAADVL